MLGRTTTYPFHEQFFVVTATLMPLLLLALVLQSAVFSTVLLLIRRWGTRNGFLPWIGFSALVGWAFSIVLLTAASEVLAVLALKDGYAPQAHETFVWVGFLALVALTGGILAIRLVAAVVAVLAAQPERDEAH